MIIEAVQGGACIDKDNNKPLQCALEIAQCPADTKFVSARNLALEYDDYSCNTEAASIPIGQCLLGIDGGLCTGEKSNCIGCSGLLPVENCFQAVNDDCTIIQPKRVKNVDDYDYAAFGMCLSASDPFDVNFCFWSRDECPGSRTMPPSENWIAAAAVMTQYNLEPCTCDKVLVGACRHRTDDILTCAVSKEACDATDETYISAKDLRLIQNAPDCRLCNLNNIDDPTTPNNNNGGGPGGAPRNNGLSNGTIAGITVGVALLAIGIVLGVVCYTNKISKGKKLKTSSTTGLD